MREEAPPTVFVIPPNDSLLCPLHFGVFEEPVDAPCGCTFCRRCIMNELSTKAECPVHGTTLLPEYLRENMQAQGAIDNLLVHCQGGLQKTTTGEWVTNPMGCRIWLSLGKRKGHEDICPYIKRSGERVPPPVRTCYYREHGCLFVGNSEQDVMVHGTSCGYGRLLHHLEQIHAQLALRDAEIARLNSLLAEKEKSTISLPNVPNVNEVLDSITRGLEKLDHDSTRLFEDAKDTLKKTKTNIVNSAAYQTSLQVLHSIKEVVESAKSEFIAKLDELISKQKVRMITNTSTNKTSSTNTHNNNNNNTNTNNNSTSTTATESTGVKETEEKLPSSTVASTTTQNIAENSLPSVNAIAEDSNKTETEGDADLHEFLEASKREYLRDQEARLVEEESIRQAVRLSLLDLANRSH